MPKQNPDCTCGRLYPDFVDYCVTCGQRVQRVVIWDEPAAAAPTTASQRSVDETDPALDFSYEDEDDGGVRGRLFPRVDGAVQSFGVEFNGDVVLGRYDHELGDVDVDLGAVPDADSISPRHARLTFDGKHWYIEDLSSEEGVFVGGARVTEVRVLRDGDELILGRAAFVFETSHIDDDDDDGDGDDEGDSAGDGTAARQSAAATAVTTEIDGVEQDEDSGTFDPAEDLLEEASRDDDANGTSR